MTTGKFLGAPVDIPHDDEPEDEPYTMSQVAQEHLDHLVERMKVAGLNEEYVRPQFLDLLSFG